MGYRQQRAVAISIDSFHIDAGTAQSSCKIISSVSLLLSDDNIIHLTNRFMEDRNMRNRNDNDEYTVLSLCFLHALEECT